MPPNTIHSLSAPKQLRKPVIAHFVHQTVAHRWARLSVHPVLPFVEVIGLLDLIRPDTLRDTHHPEELIDVVAAVPNHTAKYDKDVADVVFAQNRVGDFLGR